MPQYLIRGGAAFWRAVSAEHADGQREIKELYKHNDNDKQDSAKHEDIRKSCLQELEMSRLKQEKLSEMLAAASAAQQAADQRSKRLEIKFARSDKGHALMRSAKLQASVAQLEAEVAQLQDDTRHKVGTST